MMMTTPPPAGRTGSPLASIPLAGRVLALALTALIPLTSCTASPSSPTPPSTASTLPPAPTTSSPATSADSPAGPATRPAGTAGSPRGHLPDPATIDGTQPDAVARWVLTAWYGYDTVLDSGPSDAARRARPWLTPRLVDVVRQAAPIAAPTATWTRWAHSRAYATVRLTPGSDDHPPDTALQAFRVYAVTLALHPAQPADGTHLVAFVHLTRPTLTDTWHVEEVLTR